VRFGWREVYESSQTGLVEYSWSIEVLVAAIAGASIYLVGRAGRFATVGNWRPLQFLGMISYSLYLIHYPVSHVIVHPAHAWAEQQSWYGTPFYDWFALGVTTFALGAAILVGYGMYFLVERPSLRLAARFRRKEQAAVAN